MHTTPAHPRAHRSSGGEILAAELRRASSGGRRSADDSALLRCYATRRDPRVRDVLVRRYLPLARAIARRYCAGDKDFEDVLQVACVALVKALDRFDPELGVGFSSYAVPSIAGEVKRYYRDHTWATRVPRDLQELSLRVDRAAAALTEELGRAPDVRAIADRLGVSPDAVRDAQRATSARRSQSLDAVRADNGESLDAVLGEPDPGFARTDDRETLRPLIAALSGRERLIIALRFEHELTQAEIAAHLGVSQMAVSRTLRVVFKRLRTIAGPAASPDARPQSLV